MKDTAYVPFLCNTSRSNCTLEQRCIECSSQQRVFTAQSNRRAVHQLVVHASALNACLCTR
eukprot:9567536-Lingulodinium_polyedra.AAC.1